MPSQVTLRPPVYAFGYAEVGGFRLGVAVKRSLMVIQGWPSDLEESLLL